MRFCYCLVIAVFGISLAGCHARIPANVPLVYPIAPNTTESHVNVSQNKLTNASVSVSQSLQELAEVERASHPYDTMPAPKNPAAIGMAERTSIDWTGPIEPLVRQIAKASHYRLRVLGNKPPIPVLISLDVKDAPLADILRNASYQAQKGATISIYPKTKIIELRYHVS